MTHLFLLLALATTGGPRSVEPLGWDAKTHTLTLLTSVEGDYGLMTVRLSGRVVGPVAPLPWTLREDSTVDELQEIEALRKELTPTPAIEVAQVTLEGRVVSQHLESFSSQGFLSLYPTYSVEVTATWKTARRTVKLKTWKAPDVHLTGAWELPGAGCALLALSVMGQPYEGGYPEAQPVVVCPPK